MTRLLYNTGLVSDMSDVSNFQTPPFGLLVWNKTRRQADVGIRYKISRPSYYGIRRDYEEQKENKIMF